MPGSRGVTVIAAAGNSGVDITNQAVYPANFSLYYPHVVTVGASTNSDTRASFSNFGSPIDVVAPGFFMWSTIPGSWGWMSGTSMAAPAVAGAVADLFATGQVTARRPRCAPGWSSAPTSRPRGVDSTSAHSSASGSRPSSPCRTAGPICWCPIRPGRLVRRRPRSERPGRHATSCPGQPRRQRERPGVRDRRSAGDVHAGRWITDRADPVRTGSFSPLRDRRCRGPRVRPGGACPPISSCPAGEYAVVTELLDANGTAVGGASVGYLSVADTGDTGGDQGRVGP